MSEVDYSIDEVVKLLRCFPKAHEAAAADIIDKLRQQLEAAKRELVATDISWQNTLAENERLQSIIKKAQEQEMSGSKKRRNPSE